MISDVLVLPDTHFPFEDRRTWAALLRYASDRPWHAVVHLGDVLDHNSISRFNVENLRAVEGQSLRRDYDYANRRLDELESATPGAQKIIIEGNHDFRPEAFINRVPQLAGSIETDVGLRLAERGWQYVRYWSKGDTVQIGNAFFGHGRYTNKYHAEKHVTEYGVPFFYGHTHDVMEQPRVLHGQDKTLAGGSLGCLCRYDLPWLSGRPTKWQQAFGVFRFLPDGYFNHYCVKVFKNRFVSPEGVEYSG